MTGIDLKYNLDIDEVFAKLQAVSDRLGRTEQLITGMRSQNPFLASTQSAQQFNTQLGSQIQLFQRIDNNTQAFKTELVRLQGVYKDLKTRQNEFIAAGRYQELTSQLDQVRTRMGQIRIGLGESADQAERLGRAGRGSGGSGGGFFGNLAGEARSLAGMAGITLGAAEAAKLAVTSWAEYGKKLSEVSAITGLTGADLSYLDEQAQQLSVDSGLAGTEILEAFKNIGSIQPDILENKELLAGTTREVLALAQAASIDLPTAAQATLGSLNQFGESADQAGRYVNVLAAGALKGASEINETAEALQNSGTAMKAAGLSFEQGNALVQSLAGVMIKGSEAGTGLRNVLLKLETAGEKNLRPSVVGLDKALENASQKFNTTTELTKEFGAENIIAARRILDNREEITKMTTAITGTSVAYDQARTNTDNLATDLTKSGTGIINFFKTLGESQDGFLRTVVQGFNGFLNSITSKTGVLRAAFSEIFSFQTLLNPTAAIGRAGEAATRQSDANAIARARAAEITGIKTGAKTSVQGETDDLTKLYVKQGQELPAAQKKAAESVKKQRDDEYISAQADHQRLRKEYEKADVDERIRLSKNEFAASRRRLLAATTAKQTADSTVTRNNKAVADRAAALASANSEPQTASEKGAAEKRLKAQQDEYKLLQKASEEYLKEIGDLEDKYSKSRLDRLDKNSEDYINEKAQLDKEEIEQQRLHLEKLLQLAASNKTVVNKSTGQREVVANTSVSLANDAPALNQQFEDRKTAVDVAAARARKLLKIREDAELLELDKNSYAKEIELFDLHYAELLEKEAEGSAKRKKLIEKRDRDRPTLLLGQALEQAEQSEQVQRSLVDRLSQSDTETAVDFEKRKQEAVLKVIIDAAKKRVDLLEAIGERENVVQIVALRTTIKNAEKELTASKSAPKQYQDIFDALGVYAGMSSENVQKFQEAVSITKQAISEGLQATIQASDERINSIQAEIDAKQQQVDTETERQKEGAANNLSLRQKELDDLKRQKAEEQAVKKKAQAEQALIDSASILSTNAVTVANLVSAAAKAFEAYSGIPFLGIALSIAAAATIYATIASIRAKAKTISQLRDGGQIGGMPHELGGVRGSGQFGDIEVEGGENVTRRAMSAKFRDTLTAINSNDPRSAFQAMAREGFGMPAGQWALSLGVANQPTPAGNARLEAKIDATNERLDKVVGHLADIPKGQLIGLGDGRVLEKTGTKTTIRQH